MGIQVIYYPFNSDWIWRNRRQLTVGLDCIYWRLIVGTYLELDKKARLERDERKTNEMSHKINAGG